MRLYQHQRATNDSNGNPRRLYVGWRTRCEHGARWGEIVAVHDEGYRGRPGTLNGAYELTPATITPGDYREMIRHADAAGILHRG